MQNSNYMKISLGQNMHHPIQSNIYGGPQPNIFGNSLQSGVYHPMRASGNRQQQVNYQLVNDNSSLNRPISLNPHAIMFQSQ